MYIPAKFKQKNIEELVAIMQQYPFATLVANSSDGIEVTHLPVLLEQSDGELVLKAHVAKANKIWEKVESDSDIIVIFNGPNCYISPNYYPTKAENGKAVPTWNYVVVHAKGKVSYSHNSEWIYSVIDKLTTEHESTLDNPWSVADAPEGFIDKMLPAIVGLEIKISSITGKWKLSQNQPEVNKQGVIRGLDALGDDTSTTMAAMVRDQL
ncbi:FMN-binding negative transcriptional regulator [Vibrio parahaemolyticus]|uniref:FMN-binding negative transcriptional regulator n=1 Tax=Vibrio parahaemolyticus TaxID=670 RepID=UPI00111FC8C5|nr:FMN-binding negative transcriptional regulator [Vibrio parahaemolyticus]TXM07436.1 FMN-binding negative transcriptional regulator [Vibrio parahaemolyticus]